MVARDRRDQSSTGAADCDSHFVAVDAATAVTGIGESRSKANLTHVRHILGSLKVCLCRTTNS